MLKWIWKKPEKSAADRDSERYDVTVRVKSRQLPGFRALTLDISGSGLQLETEGPLEKGKTLLLELEFDRDELPDFHCPAEVMWSKGDDTRRQYSAGLAFRPVDNETKLNLARMGAVLETRSEADIKVLLAEANKLDATREAFFSQKNADNVRTPEAPPTPVPQTPDVHPGVLIPVDVRINAYHWDRNTGFLAVHYTEAQQNHELLFPDCQACYDHQCSANQTTLGLQVSAKSARVEELQARRGKVPWKHYQFLGSNDEPILEIISRGCEIRVE